MKDPNADCFCATDDTELSKSDKDVLNDVLVTELTYVFILHPVSGGLAIFSVMLSVLGHFFKTSCFVFFGEGNIVAFAAITAAGIAGLASFGIELAFLLYANSHLQGPDMNLNVASIVLSLAGGVLSFTAFVLAFLHFNRSYSSGVVDQLGHNEDGHSEQTETDFWTDGERAERNERMLHAQEQAEKKAYESIRANDLKSMNNFLARGQQPTVYEAPLPELPKTPRNPYSGPAPGDHWTQTPRTLKKSSKKYSKTWDRPTSRFDETPLPPRPQSGNVRSIPKAKRRDTQDKLEELEAQDEVKPLDLYQAKPPRKGFKAPP